MTSQLSWAVAFRRPSSDVHLVMRIPTTRLATFGATMEGLAACPTGLPRPFNFTASSHSPNWLHRLYAVEHAISAVRNCSQNLMVFYLFVSSLRSLSQYFVGLALASYVASDTSRKDKKLCSRMLRACFRAIAIGCSGGSRGVAELGLSS